MLKFGIIGCDTSHVEAFAELLGDPLNPYHTPGARITVAFPGGSPDFDLSISRVEGYTNLLREQYGVQIVSSPEEVAEIADVILIESVDGRVHLEQFRRIAPFGKPIFVDKPFTVNSLEAREISALAREHKVLFMSCSPLRYAEGFEQALAHIKSVDSGKVIGADCYGPMELEATQPGLFWYGIHAAEMLYAAMGTGCKEVSAYTNEDHEFVQGVWADGRIGTIRGNRKGNNKFGAVIHGEKQSAFADVYAYEKPYYAGLMEGIMEMVRSGVAPIAPEETEEIIRFLEAANESRESGLPVAISG